MKNEVMVDTVNT